MGGALKRCTLVATNVNSRIGPKAALRRFITAATKSRIINSLDPIYRS